jgi:hypothetical protein
MRVEEVVVRIGAAADLVRGVELGRGAMMAANFPPEIVAAAAGLPDSQATKAPDR